MALTDTYVLRDVQEIGGEKILNVYTYQDLLLTSNAEILVTEWIAQFIPVVKALQGTGLNHVLVDAVRLGDPSNFYEQVINTPGISSGDMLPSHDAVSFTYRLNTRSLRPGSKRIAGITEAEQSNGVLGGSGVPEALENLRLALKAVIMGGIVETFKPVVVKRVKYAVPGTDPVRYAYRFPETEEEFVFGDVVEVLLNNKVSHQVSRGNGR